jgi:hypothetical protein
MFIQITGVYIGLFSSVSGREYLAPDLSKKNELFLSNKKCRLGRNRIKIPWFKSRLITR